MTRIQGWIIIGLLAVLAVNFLIIDFVVINMVQGVAEMSSEAPIDYPTDIPTDIPTESVPTITCDTDGSCEESTE